MDKTERETRDFMNVESFSQLPFIRSPPPVREKNGAIRLFGKEFGTTTSNTNNHSYQNNSNPREVLEANKDTSSENIEMSNRKFECHYCCRNFPTSQALGGHQNAHKRERQHAKRAHLQSSLSDAHLYGLMNYSHIGSTATFPIGYHSWNNSSSHYSANSRFYGSQGNSYRAHHQQPINGSPLALWRINSSVRRSSALSHERASIPMQPQIPVFNSSKDDKLKAFSAVSGGFGSGHSRFGYESKASMQDHVSLDLHL